MKELISFRFWDMNEETWLIEKIKEQCCFLSLNFLDDMKKRKNYNLSYVLPDYVEKSIGHIKVDLEKHENEQILNLNNERISIPEILFNPNDIGINQGGIHEMLYHSITSFDEEIQKHVLYDNILITGGNTKFRNFQKRLLQDITKISDSKYDITIHEAKDPLLNCWNGCRFISESFNFKKFIVSKFEYEEYGHKICRERFVL
jgi:actin-related protein 6